MASNSSNASFILPPRQSPPIKVEKVGEELVEDLGAAAGGDEAVEADGERLMRDAALAEQRRQEAEQRERVVGREEAYERKELRLLEPAGLGGRAAEHGGGGAREPRAGEADEERREGGGRVGEAALGGGRVEEVERALRRGGRRDEAHELRVVEVAGVWEKPRWAEAALKRSSARCAEGDDAMRRTSSGWWRYRGGGGEGGGGGGGGGEGGAPRAGLRYWSGEIHGSAGLVGAGGSFMVGGRRRGWFPPSRHSPGGAGSRKPGTDV
nr:unnamed protein product [Digitaria exilis]